MIELISEPDRSVCKPELSSDEHETSQQQSFLRPRPALLGRDQDWERWGGGENKGNLLHWDQGRTGNTPHQEGDLVICLKWMLKEPGPRVRTKDLAMRTLGIGVMEDSAKNKRQPSKPK